MNTSTKTDGTSPHRSLQAGDEVYFDHPQHGVLFGSVAGIGRDGATIDVQDDDGTTREHRVRHSAIIGHRKRAQRKVVIIDRGEDGSLAVDETGKRVFLRGEVPEPEALGKALGGAEQAGEGVRLAALVRAAVEPVQAAMAAMQETHRAEMERLAQIVETIATKPPTPLKASRTKDGGMLTRPATDADLAEVAS